MNDNLEEQTHSKNKKKHDKPPANLLLNERINAKMFQIRLKAHNVELSLWEIFNFFEYLNTVIAK